MFSPMISKAMKPKVSERRRVQPRVERADLRVAQQAHDGQEAALAGGGCRSPPEGHAGVVGPRAGSGDRYVVF
jgi:hypothetical protein